MRPALRDGLPVDDAGNAYVTQYGASLVRVFSDAGKAWGTIKLPEGAINATFGGADRRTLYITTTRGLYEVKTNIPGLP